MTGKIATIFDRSWKYRRWAVFTQLAVADTAILYLMVFGQDNALNRDMIQAIFIFLTFLTNGYIFGGIWDDKVKDNTIINAPGSVKSTTTTSEVTTAPSKADGDMGDHP